MSPTLETGGASDWKWKGKTPQLVERACPWSWGKYQKGDQP